MSELRTVVNDGVALLELHAPERRNALTASLATELTAALRALPEDPSVGAIVVTGAGPAFCAGADLAVLEGSAPDVLATIYQCFVELRTCALPTIAAVNGPAIGAGMNLALSCDVRLAAASARFETKFLRLGVHPGGGHAWMLDRAVGPQAAAAMLLFGERINGARAAEIGLAWRAVIEVGELLAEAQELGARAASAPRELVCEVKQTLRRAGSAASYEDEVDLEAAAQLASMGRVPFRKAVSAARRASGTGGA